MILRFLRFGLLGETRSQQNLPGLKITIIRQECPATSWLGSLALAQETCKRSSTLRFRSLKNLESWAAISAKLIYQRKYKLTGSALGHHHWWQHRKGYPQNPVKTWFPKSSDSSALKRAITASTMNCKRVIDWSFGRKEQALPPYQRSCYDIPGNNGIRHLSFCMFPSNSWKAWLLRHEYWRITRQ